MRRPANNKEIPSGDTTMAKELARNKEIPSGDTTMARRLARNKEIPSGDTTMARRTGHEQGKENYYGCQEDGGDCV